MAKWQWKRNIPKITFEQAIDLVTSAKSAERVRPRTLKDYHKDWGYFVKWVEQNYEIETIDELTPQSW